jgi:dTDP-4-amino-4,6-dideoxygalactose transaminase
MAARATHVHVPMFDQAAVLAPLRPEIDAAIARVLDRGSYILGQELEAFEAELSAHLGVGHVVGVGNGTDAITLALAALGVGPGDEVVVPSFTFFASAEAIVPTGARPVFCDVDPETCCVTADTVRAALTPRTRAIVAVDLFGNPYPAAQLRELGVPVIEDAAQAAGAWLDGRRAGSLGTLATFSFYPSKNLPGFGDGGAVATDDERLAERLRLLRSHGSREPYMHELIGYNSRLDELQAALLRVLLPELDGWAQARRQAGVRYGELGLGRHVALPGVTDGAEPAWHLYVIRHPERARIAHALADAGVQSRVYYGTPVHRQRAMRPYAAGAEAALPATDELARSHLAIPIGPTLTTEQLAHVVETVAATLGTR